MPFQSVPETAEATPIFLVNGQLIQNTYHGRKSGGYSTADLEAFAEAVDLSVAAHQLPLLSTEVTYVRTEVRGLEFENDQVVIDSTSTDPGTIASPPLPLSVSFAVKRTSGFTGRSARGRVYWPSVNLAQVLATDENRMAVSNAAAVVNAIEEMRLDIVAAGWVPVIVSRFANGAPRAEGVTFNWTGTSSDDNRFDSRRDRMPAE